MGHVGLSEVTVEQLTAARRIVEVACVQNLYNLTDRRHEAVVGYCVRENIAFIPWLPLAAGRHARPGGSVDTVAAQLGATRRRSRWPGCCAAQVITPIPGTSSAAHLEENLAAADLELPDAAFATLSRLV